MKITVNTPALMIVTARPWLLSGALLALLAISLYLAARAVAEGEWLRAVALAMGFGGASVLAFGLFAQAATLRLDRAAGKATLSRRGLLRRSEATYDLAMIDAACLETAPAPPGRRMPASARAVLRFRPGSGQAPVPILPGFSAGTGPEQAVQAITAWLEAG